MRKTLAPLLSLLTPVVALAQVPQQGPIERDINTSPAFWYWVVLLIVAAAAFAWTTVRLSRRRRGPPPGRGPRTPRAT